MDSIVGGIISAVIASIIATIVSLLGTKYTVGMSGFHHVSSERITWIRNMQKLYARFASYCRIYNHNKKEFEGVRQQFSELCEEMKISFSGNSLNSNPGVANSYPADLEAIKIIKTIQIAIDAGSQISDHSLEMLYKYLQLIIKGEWDKIKIESGDNNKKKNQVEKIQEQVRSDFETMRSQLSKDENGYRETDGSEGSEGETRKKIKKENDEIALESIQLVMIIFRVLICLGVAYLLTALPVIDITINRTILIGLIICLIVSRFLVDFLGCTGIVLLIS